MGTIQEEALAEMQQRFRILEEEREEYYRKSRAVIRQNNEVVAGARKENKELRKALQSLRQEQTHKAKPEPENLTSAGDRDLEAVEESVKLLKSHYNTMRYDSEKKIDTHRLLEDRLADLERASVRPQNEDSLLAKQIRGLENRLDKAMMKYNEAESLRRTYEDIVKRLNIERLGYDEQIAALQKTMDQKLKDYEELAAMSHEARYAQDQAKRALRECEIQVKEERAHRKQALENRRVALTQTVEHQRSMEEAEARRQDIHLAGTGDLSEEGEKSLKQAVVTAVFSTANHKTKIDSEEKKIQTYEEAFRKIKEVTGVEDANEVIVRVLSQEDTYRNLQMLSKEAQDTIDALFKKKDEMIRKLEDYKFSREGPGNSRRHVSAAEATLWDAGNDMDRKGQKFERVVKNTNEVKTGVKHLWQKLESIKLEGETSLPPMSDDTVVEIFKACEKKLMVLIDAAEKAGVDVSPGELDESEEIEPDLSTYNTRVDVDDEDDAYKIRGDFDGYIENLSDNEYEDEIEEDVLNRVMVKRNSALLVERATKKTKRKARGRSSN